MDHKYHYIIWDFDGTLFDTYPSMTEVYYQVLTRDYQIEISQSELQSLLKRSVNYCLETIFPGKKVDEEKLFARLKTQYQKQDKKSEVPFAYTGEILKKVQSIGQNFLVTHKSLEFLMPKLAEYQYTQYFKEIVAMEHGYPLKPDPTSFLYLIEKYNLPKDKTIAFGDRDLDIGAGIGAGIDTLFFDPVGNHYPQATYNIKDYADIQNWW
ncbi:MAG: HAD hydrolase-like protein [Spirochaetes bacterium]|nr:HAD hydrolase-like protein [Spirochaetota bacterium]